MQARRVDLVTGEQELERESELREEMDDVGFLHDAEQVRTEDGTCNEQQHGFGNDLARNHMRYERTEHSCGNDGKQ